MEIAGSREELEARLGVEIPYFAYPYGKEDPAVRDLVVAAGYRAACSTRCGFNRAGCDPYLLRRIDVFGTDRLWQFRQKVTWGINEASRLYPLKYVRGRIAARLGGG
ncbi:MAG: polysaccharide deacetylase family protein [Nitrospirae bacterium]|nr:MAG: polysaccharide deacetylase family protein [Nitrospirota bacterium]